MPAAEKKRILLADSDLLSAATTIGTLKDDYHVVTAKDAADIRKKLKKLPVDMLILETRLPDTDGYELCRQLKTAAATAALPVVFLTSDARVTAEEQGFAAGAVEYIVKPISAPTLKARLKNQFRLSDAMAELQRLNRLALDANPNTGLPGNTSIMAELQRLLEESEPASVVYADLDNFKPYNDHYGFARGDEVISFSANVMRVAMQQHGCSEAFLGHIGGDDFVLVLPVEKQTEVMEEIIRRFDQGIGEFYHQEDLDRGYLQAVDREGQERQFPLISISMGAIDLSQSPVESALKIVDICTETKSLAKSRTGSNFVVDRRRS